MTNLDKNQILKAINDEKIRIGSYSRVASKCGVSAATISQMLNNNWELIKDEMWLKVADALGLTSSDWKIAETGNYKLITKLLDFARYQHEYVVISAKAGSGKSATIRQYIDMDETAGVFSIQAREWARREFLLNLCQQLGINPGSGYVSVDKLGEKVIRFFADRQQISPLLIIDEADKLKPAALRFLIHFYNELEDKAGCVISGTENLEIEMKKGVQYSRKGYDEIDSRFGRNYIHLRGATLQDVKDICSINGITDAATQEEVFKSSNPIMGNFNGHFVKVVEDMRRIKRSIKREIMRKGIAA